MTDGKIIHLIKKTSHWTQEKVRFQVKINKSLAVAPGEFKKKKRSGVVMHSRIVSLRPAWATQCLKEPK
jgi:hypothetical protein